jgi:hypothetical protein
MKYTFTLFAFGLLLVGCSRHLSDADIIHKAVGSWALPHQSDKMEVRSDGSWLIGTGTNVAGGSWHVENGYIVSITTNMPGPPRPFAPPVRFKVIRIDDHQMILLPEGQTNSLTMSKP